MFENLSDRLEAVYKKLKGRGVLKEGDVDEALREIRVALIEADVSLPVLKGFLEQVREKAIGQEVLKSLTPGHQMVKVVNDELTGLLGDDFREIEMAPKPPTILLMAGLILYETSNIIHGGETNYIMATVTLFVAIFNLFTSLLHLLGHMNGNE